VTTMGILHGARALTRAQRALPATRTMQLSDGPLEYIIAGEGSPAIVLVNEGMLPLNWWARVLAQLAQISTVYAYNRRGVGASAAPRKPQTATVVVDELRAALAAADLQPPHVLVGHGLGALHVNLYARRFPQELAGVVLLEPTHPDDDILERLLRFLPRPIMRALISAGRSESQRNAEDRFMTQTAREINQAGPFPDLPLTVISGARAPSAWAMSRERIARHAARQQQLVALSAIGKHTIAARSGHSPQVSNPEIVVRAIREIINGG